MLPSEVMNTIITEITIREAIILSCIWMSRLNQFVTCSLHAFFSFAISVLKSCMLAIDHAEEKFHRPKLK